MRSDLFSKHRDRSIFFVSTALVSLWALPAAAQSAAGQASAQSEAAQSASSSIQEIVVTATRRAANLQEVPVAIVAVPASVLKDQNITGALQLSDVVPGLQVSPGAGNSLYLRGVGSTSGNGYTDPQIATYMDGVYIANPATSILSFNNIDQVEVLKGPQGTLYGRNATGGLIAITTREPSATPRIDASVGYGNYDTRTENFYGSTPITDNLAANISIYDTKQSKGWSTNVFTGHGVQKNSETGVQAKLLWKPAAGTKITGSFLYDTNDRTYGLAQEILPGTVGNDGTRYLGEYRAVSRIDADAPLDAGIASLKIEQDLGFANLMSLTAYQNSWSREIQPSVANLGQPLAGQGALIYKFNQGNKTLSQEFQLTSKPSASKLDWVAGLYYYHDRLKVGFSTFTTCVGAVCAPGSVPTTTTGYPTVEAYAGYVDATYHLSSATRVTGGLRYTDETRGLTGKTTPLAGFPNSVAALAATAITYPGQPYPGNPAGIPTSVTANKLTYRIVLAQDLGPNLHAYVSDNTGFKAPAYSNTAFTNPPVQSELLHSYEAGLKSELFERRLRLNVAYFHYNYTNLQVRSFNFITNTPLLQNAASARYDGVDADFSLVPVKNLTINGGFEYTRAKYIDFPGATCYAAGPTAVVNGVTVGSVRSATCNLAGRPIPYAVPVSASLGFTYRLETPEGGFDFTVNDRYNNRYHLDSDGSVRAPDAHIVNASVTWKAPNGHFDVQFYGRNLSNTYQLVSGGASANGLFILPGAPRTVGFTVGYHY